MSDSLGTKVAPQALMGLFEGTQVKTNMEEFSAECHSVDCSGDSVVLTNLTKLEIAIRLFQTINQEFERRVRLLFTR